MYLTGGVGVTEGTERFAANYELPHGGYCEGCAGCGLAYWCLERARTRPEQTLPYDVYERVLYNNILGTLSEDGLHYFYRNPLSDVRVRDGWHSSPCCVGNIARALLALKDNLFSVSEDGKTLYVNNYMEIETDDFKMETGYPLDGKVRLAIKRGRYERILARYPNRSASRLYRAEPDVRSGYVPVGASWELPMPDQTVTAIPEVSSCAGLCAQQRGPIVFSWEGPNLDRRVPNFRRLNNGGESRVFVARPAASPAEGLSGLDSAPDPSRPRFHYTPRRGGMIDVWGGARYRDSWRLFYDLNVHGLDVNGGYELGGSFFQLKTKDFIHWEEVGLALDPDKANGECYLNDGNVIVRDDGTPLVYYTSIKADPKLPNEHVPLVCDGEMRHFTRLESGRITVDNHGGPKYDGKGWSDVWMFREAGRRFMIISKCVREDNGRDEIPIYEATDETWLRWRYLGTFLEKSGEVVNFAKVGDKWILVFSPYGNPVYHVGDFDARTGRFTPQKSGILSYGYSNQGGGVAPHLAARGFYATTFMPREDGRQVITAWIGGFICPDGWNGAVALPRDLTIDDDLTPRMWPVKEFESLRGRSVELANRREMPSFGGSFDLEFEFRGWAYVRVGKSLSVCSTGWQTSVNGTMAPLPPGETPNRLRIVADVSTVEVFVNGGRVSATRTIPMIRPDDTVRVEVIADTEAGGTASSLKGMLHEIADRR